MKKIFTLLFAAATMSTAFAQYDPKEEWDNKKDDRFEKNNSIEQSVFQTHV